MEAARGGDTDAFAVLYQRYKTEVWNMALFTLRDHHEAEDSLQETFLKAYRAVGQHRPGSSTRAWLLTICRNVCLDRMRARPRRAALSLDDGAVGLEPFAPEHDRDGWIDFMHAFGELPDEEREAFFLVDVMGCHSDEAARIVGVRAASTLRSRVARARRQLVPALSPNPVAPLAQVWGVYHSGREAAIVACVGGCAADGNGAAQELLARLRDSGSANPAARPALDIVRFFDRLDHRIPDGRPVLAVVDGYPRGDEPAGRWLAAHPRWELRCAETHTSWLNEVERLIDASAARNGGSGPPVLSRLANSEPFFWVSA